MIAWRLPVLLVYTGVRSVELYLTPRRPCWDWSDSQHAMTQQLTSLTCFALSLVLGLTLHLRLARGWLAGLASLLLAFCLLTVACIVARLYGDEYLEWGRLWTLAVEDTWPHLYDWVSRRLMWIVWR